MWIIPKNLKQSHSAPGTGDLNSVLNYWENSELGISLFVKSKPMQLQQILKKCKRDKWFHVLCGQISKHYVPNLSEDIQTCSQQDSPVSLSHVPGVKKPTKTSVIYSQISLELLTSADQQECSLKMSKDLSQQNLKLESRHLNMSLEVWEREVIEQRGLYAQRVKQVQDTEENESLSWENYPTPRASDAEGGRIETIKTKTGWKSVRKKSGQLFGAKLRDAIETEAEQNPKFWATPTASDWKNMDSANQIMLCKQVKTLPTPTARDYHAPRLPEAMKKTNRNPLTNSLGDAIQFLEGKTYIENGTLNPNWVEKLMGLPEGYTSFDWDGKPFIGSWKDDSWEKDVPRTVKKTEFKEERIRMLGNGVVPQTAAIAWQILNDELSNSI